MVCAFIHNYLKIKYLLQISENIFHHFSFRLGEKLYEPGNEMGPQVDILRCQLNFSHVHGCRWERYHYMQQVQPLRKSKSWCLIQSKQIATLLIYVCFEVLCFLFVMQVYVLPPSQIKSPYSSVTLSKKDTNLKFQYNQWSTTKLT